MLNSVENEWLTMHLLAAMGLPVADTEIARFADQKVLVVNRFDRQWMDGERWIARLPQEDFCQATATSPLKKYENEGGPGIAKCLQLLAGSASSDLDREWFILGQLAFWMLAATDGHAKNFSLFLRPGDAYQMTPFYDVLSLWPLIGDGANQLHRSKVKMAMSVRTPTSHYHLDRIQPRHWEALAASADLPRLRLTMFQLAEGVEAAIATVHSKLPPDFPMRLWDSITTGLRSQAQLFMRDFHPH
jgi:serine/threonine-protein kinase HipA